MTLPGFVEHGGRRVLLKYHKFNSGRRQHAPNSLAALDEVLAARVAVIEFDVGRLGDGTFAVLHDTRLERETTGVGELSGIGVEALKELRLRGSDAPPALLEEVLQRLATHHAPVKVQVDLKEIQPISAAAATRLVEALAKVRENSHLSVVVGCMADWNLRALRRLDPSLAVGNDPAFYLHAPTPGMSLPVPSHVNAYGYVDDHPLGFRRVTSVAEYLRDRLDSIVGQVPGTTEFYLHKGFVVQALADDFDPVGHLRREAGMFVDVWTLNSGDVDFARDLRIALVAGADQITTDTATEVAAHVSASDA